MGWEDEEANNVVFTYELPSYPHEFTSDQRLTAYWQMIRSRRKPDGTGDWYKFLRAAESSAETRELIVAGVKAERTERPAQPEAQPPELSSQGDARVKEARAELERAQADEARWRRPPEHTDPPAETDTIDPEDDDLV